MSQFTTELVVEQIDDKYWKLIEGFEYHVGEYPSDEIVKVPAGFITDFASVPKIFHSILPPTGPYKAAAMVHDFCYQTAIYSKTKSDLIFLEGMKVLNVSMWIRQLMFYSVFLFGWYAWFNHRRKDKK